MSYANPTPIPPTTILTSRPISQSAALDFLKAYLDRAANDPSLPTQRHDHRTWPSLTHHSRRTNPNTTQPQTRPGRSCGRNTRSGFIIDHTHRGSSGTNAKKSKGGEKGGKDRKSSGRIKRSGNWSKDRLWVLMRMELSC